MPLARDIDAYETRTLNFLDARGELTDGNFGGVPVRHFAPTGRDDYFYQARHTKHQIVLHYTAGFLGGDLSTLTKDDFHVSVPFVIARNGTIVQLFDPEYWSYHLGPGARGGNTFCSRQSVAIEISNIGPLDRSGNWMWNAYGDKYCAVSESQYYTDLGAPYRGHRYYASFTDAQYTALEALLPAISAHFGIAVSYIAGPARFELFDTSGDAKAYRGVCSHVNFRPAGEKTDIGPAFDWPRIGG